MSEEINKQEMMEKIYGFALEQKQAGKSDAEIQASMEEKGMDAESAKEILDNLNRSIAGQEEESGFGYSWLIWVAALIGINVLSYIFNWPFWIY